MIRTKTKPLLYHYLSLLLVPNNLSYTVFYLIITILPYTYTNKRLVYSIYCTCHVHILKDHIF